jgi:hypothetical protein
VVDGVVDVVAVAGVVAVAIPAVLDCFLIENHHLQTENHRAQLYWRFFGGYSSFMGIVK